MSMLYSCPSLGCKVQKIGKSVSRVDELPDEWHAIEGIPIGEQHHGNGFKSGAEDRESIQFSLALTRFYAD